MELFLVLFAALFSIVNPLGTVPIFVGLTDGKAKKEINRIAFFTALNTFVILFVSFFIGKYILQFFGVTLDSLRIAGGLIIASSGFALLTGSFKEHKGIKNKVKEDVYTRSDISLTPLAIPMLAGPGGISLLITYHQQYPKMLDQGIIVSAILLICIVIYVMLRSSGLIVKVLGASGINALSRIIGFIVIAIGVEYIVTAITSILGVMIK